MGMSHLRKKRKQRLDQLEEEIEAGQDFKHVKRKAGRVWGITDSKLQEYLDVLGYQWDSETEEWVSTDE